MISDTHHDEDGRDQEDIEREITSIATLPSPSDDPEKIFLASVGKYLFQTINAAMVQTGSPNEAVPNCSIRLGSLVSQSNNYGQAQVDIKDLSDGEHILTIEAPNTLADDVSPDLELDGSNKYAWRRVTGKINKSGDQLSLVSGDDFININGQTVIVGLWPVWMEASGKSSRGSTQIDSVIIHHTGSNNLRGDLRTLVYSGAVSSHYLIPPSGNSIKLVNESDKAWHAGFAHWSGSENINARSIGIEITNSAKEYAPEQIAAVVDLIKRILDSYPTISPQRVLGHSDVAVNRPETRPPKRHGRKSTDPGSAFLWEKLEENGWGLVPIEGTLPNGAYGKYFHFRPSGALRSGDRDSAKVFGGEVISDVESAVEHLQRDLKKVGYYVGDIDGSFGSITRWALQMFQQHIFSGSRRTSPLNSGDGRLDGKTAEMLKRVIGEADFVGA